MHCNNCNTTSQKDAMFCSNCGKPHSVKINNSIPKSDRNDTKSNFSNKIIAVISILVFIGFRVYSTIENDAVKVNNEALDSFESGNSKQAIVQFEEASKTAVSNENKINSLKNLAYVYESEGQDTLALTTFKEALVLSKFETYDYYLISGEIALLENRPIDARLAYEKAYKISPNEFQINNSLSLFYLDINDFFPEQVDYSKALNYALRADEFSDLQLATENFGRYPKN